MIIPLFLIGRPSVPKLSVVMQFRPQHVVLVPVESGHTTAPALQPRVLRYTPFAAPIRVPRAVMDLSDIVAPEPNMVTSDFAGTPASELAATTTFGPPTTPPPPVSVRQQATGHVGPLRVSQGVQEAKLIRKVMPVYPEIARSIRQFGTVRLVAVVGKDGHISEVHVLSGPAYLVTAAVAAVKQWIYKPTLLNGEPMEVISPITVNFTLSQ